MVDKIFRTLYQRYPVLSQMNTYNGKWSYDYGVVLMGVRRLYQATNDTKYLQYMEQNLSPFIAADGSIGRYQLESYNIDNLNNGKILFALYSATGEERYKKALDLLYSQLKEHPRTSEGVFWHKKIYPWQIWLDGLYMGAPFYAEYLLSFCAGEGLDDITNQFSTCWKHTVDSNTGLLYHAWDESHEQAWCHKETGRAPHVWGRAMGWYMMALIDVIEMLPPQQDGHPILCQLFTKTAVALRQQQQPNGVWLQVLDCPDRRGNYYEASCTSMFVAALARGVKLGVLSADEWAPVLSKAWQGLQNEFVFYTKEGWVNLCSCCAVAGLGGDEKRDGSFVYYISEPIITNDMKAYGALLQAAIAMRDLGL